MKEHKFNARVTCLARLSSQNTSCTNQQPVSRRYIKRILTALLASLCISATVAIAQSPKVVVVPFSGGIAPPDRVLVTVGNEPGEGDYQSVATALAAITDASASKRHAIFLTPGEHTTANMLQMKEFVDLIGSGDASGSTTLIGTVSSGNFFSNSSVIRAANNMRIADMFIRNEGDNASNLYAALEVDNTSPDLSNLVLSSSGGSANYGLLVENGAAPKVEMVSARAFGGGFARGVFINGAAANLTFEGLTATASAGTSSNRSIQCSGAPSISQRYIFRNSNLSAEDSGAQAVFIKDCNVELISSEVRSDGTGIFYETSDAAFGDIDVVESAVFAPTVVSGDALQFSAGRSTLVGSVNPAGIKSCGETDDEISELDSACNPPPP